MLPPHGKTEIELADELRNRISIDMIGRSDRSPCNALFMIDAAQSAAHFAWAPRASETVVIASQRAAHPLGALLQGHMAGYRPGGIQV